jgi:DNA (cytosine-5)-methyltransferase 1
MGVYFNEFDPFASQWLRNLYPDATVDPRSIVDVRAEDVAGFRRVHFFAGIAGWEYALELAGWPAEWECWSGSCPCQPFSCAGKRGGEKDERHLWPEFYRLISECRPAIVFGEQVASKDGLEWLDGISLDLEELGYAVGASDLPAAGQGAPHIRQRFFWTAISQLGHADKSRRNARGQGGGELQETRLAVPTDGSEVRGMADSQATGRHEQCRESGRTDGEGGESNGEQSSDGCGTGGMGFAGVNGLGRDCGAASCEEEGGEREGEQNGRRAIEPTGAGGGVPWEQSILIPCRDSKFRRISSQSGDEPLAPRIPKDLGQPKSELRRLARRARNNRTGRLKGYGNAIVPQVAALFIETVMEVLSE